jgi:glutamine synthetase
VTTLNIEAETAADMARTQLLPAALQYIALLDDAGDGAGVERLQAEIAGLTDEFVESIFALEEANVGHPETDDVLEAAKYVQSTVIPAMEANRAIGDRLERIVPDSLWPLPKYAEILFIK